MSEATEHEEPRADGAEESPMVGDCDNCGHSIAYHIPLAGCVKCSCGEFQ